MNIFFRLIVIGFFLVSGFGMAQAGTCTDGSIPAGRFYAESVTRLMAEDNTWAEFKVKKDGVESGWIAFDASTTAGKNSLSLLLTAGTAKKKVSFYVTAGQCNGNKLNVTKFQIEFE